MQTDRLTKGNIGEMKVRSKFTELGYITSTPDSVAPYDIIVDVDGGLKKVQVKTSRVKESDGRTTYAVGFRKTGRFYDGSSKNSEYSKDEVDYFAIYNDIEDEVYVLDFDAAPSWGTDKILESWREDKIDRKF